ncbi:IMP dehydrogenase [Bacteroidota bacterium]
MVILFKMIKKNILGPSGLNAKELFFRGEGLTYIDFTVLDTIFTEITKKDISLTTDIGKGITLETPIIAAPMDTVTNAELCIALAYEGGIGAIHYNHKDKVGNPDVDAQISEIEKVKRARNGFIENPIAVSPDMTIKEVIQLSNRFDLSHLTIDTFPVTENGKSNGKFVGLLRKQDYSKSEKTDLLVKDRMLPLGKVMTGKLPITLKEANQILWDEHILNLPIVDEEGYLKYLVTRSDIDKHERFPLATVDERNRLRVLFAVDTRESAYERLERGFAAGADGVIIDTSQGFTLFEKNILKYIVKRYPEKLVIGGNIATREAADFLCEIGADAFRNGQGSGSICTTAGAIGISRAGATGVYDSGFYLRTIKSNLKNIADGGLKEVGDIFKALSIGAHAVMLGNMLAGTTECPGEVIVDPKTGLPTKMYRGMGSKEANVGGIRGYGTLPQGISGEVPYKGSIHEWVPLIRDGILSAMQVQNCKTIKQLHENLYLGKTRFERRSPGSINESKPHDIKY